MRRMGVVKPSTSFGSYACACVRACVRVCIICYSILLRMRMRMRGMVMIQVCDRTSKRSISRCAVVRRDAAAVSGVSVDGWGEKTSCETIQYRQALVILFRMR
jgi:hypothetical protein